MALRARQAHLLGYDTYCDYILEDRMVQSLPNLRRFMDDLKAAVLPKAQSELKELSEIIVCSDSSDCDIMPWDVSYLSEKLKQQ
ncbi:MAG: peptidase M3, partial [Paludibacteraceae bacterium]|nr:peptidase M3 [Paludibacteraceae bacterium]